MDEHNRFGNWIPDENRWNLEAPPQWWLQALWDFDNQLVVLPSRHQQRYLLARRRKYSAGLGDVAMLDNKHPDTNLCFVNHCVPIAPLNFSGEWTLTILDQLRERDTWAITGGPTSTLADPEAALNRLADAVDAADAKREAKINQQNREMFYQMGRDAWRSMQARIGARNKRASDYHGVARPSPVTSG